jgi:hypothetical protein
MAQQQPFLIDRFLGVNKTSTESLLQLGEAADMINWIITDDLKLEKTPGYARLFESLGAHRINGQWYGKLGGTKHFVFSCNGHIYEHNLTTHANTDLGAIADALTTFFTSNNTLYILDGTEYYKWSGSGSIVQVAGYIPTVYTASPPAGGGTILESINYLTGTKSKKYSGNGSATLYQLPELSINSVDTVYVNGVLQTNGVNYTVNLTNGTVTFAVAPATGVNNVVITWTKTVAGDRATITKNMYYGGVYYSRFWLFGNPDYKNSRFPSGVTMDGVSDPSFFPKYGDSNVGEYEITDMVIQYNKQIIYTAGDSDGASAWYSEEEDYTDATTGAVMALFPVYPMNKKFGNVAKGQTQIIMNNPFTIDKGIYEWIATYIADEKNAVWKSERIQNDLDQVDLTKAITIDWNDKGLYWLCVGKKVWVYNYRVATEKEQGVWYVLEFPHEPTCFLICEQDLYIGTTDGKIMRYSKDYFTFDGETISATWEMGFYSFGSDWLRKFIQRLFITIKPYSLTHVDISYETDLDNTSDTYTASYALSNFDNWNFWGIDATPEQQAEGFSFETNYSPQPFKFKIRAKKIDNFKLKLKNDGTDTATVLTITIPTRISGEVKGAQK